MQATIQPECKRDKVAEEKYLYLKRRKYQDEKLCDLYSLPNIIRIINSRKIIWSNHITRIEEKYQT
jgi:hypothetical protein